MKKKRTIRELALILLPVIALGAYGLWTRGKHSAPSANAYQFTLQSIQVEPATPRDVYEGFDTLVKVNYRYPPAPKLPNATQTSTEIAGVRDPHLVSKVGGKVQRVKLSPADEIKCLSRDTDFVEFRLRLSKVPIKDGELTLKAALQGGYGYNVTLVNGRAGKSLQIPPLPISIVVRKAGERIEVPQVSKHRPYRVKFIAPDPDIVLSPTEGSVRVIIELMDDVAQDAEKNSWQFMRPRLVDSRGREYVDYQNIGKKFFFLQLVDPTAKDEDPKTYERVFTFSTNLLPKDAGKLIFKSEVSLNDGWPLPISHIIRP